jgi:CBS domain-containing protein
MIIRDCMKTNVFSIREDELVTKAAKLFLENHIGTLPVVNKENKLVGILTLQCMLKITMPDFVNVVENFDFIPNFGAVRTKQPERSELFRPVHDIMKKPVFVEEDWSLIHAAAILDKEESADIPVVSEDGILVGLASHVDIGTGLIQQWDLDFI